MGNADIPEEPGSRGAADSRGPPDGRAATDRRAADAPCMADAPGEPDAASAPAATAADAPGAAETASAPDASGGPGTSGGENDPAASNRPGTSEPSGPAATSGAPALARGAVALPAPLRGLPANRPVLVAGPTGSGKSALALALAEAAGGIVVNADAMQVFAHWRVLTARPGAEEHARAPHALYGHVDRFASYSAGHWLREIAPLLEGRERPIIVGGTGLYFAALTEGLAEIPEIPAWIRAEADRLSPDSLLAGIDAETRARIDTANPARLRRAWEVRRATGRGLAAWHDATPPPLLPPRAASRVVIEAPPERLTPRLADRFDAMLAAGALEEVSAALPDWSPTRPGDRAIGAAELVRHLRGETDLATARAAAIVATRRYAKRQRTWFRARMGDWARIPARGG
jgi:tRNA dimethylallyltransferase